MDHWILVYFLVWTYHWFWPISIWSGISSFQVLVKEKNWRFRHGLAQGIFTLADSANEDGLEPEVLRPWSWVETRSMAVWSQPWSHWNAIEVWENVEIVMRWPYMLMVYPRLNICSLFNICSLYIRNMTYTSYFQVICWFQTHLPYVPCLEMATISTPWPRKL